MKHLFTKAKAVLLVCAALFSANLAFAETGHETEQNATGGGSSNAQVDGQSYYVAGTYIAGLGSAQTGDMTSKGFKLRTGSDGKRAVFSVNANYTIKSLTLTGASNYELNEGGTQDVKVIKVEADGVEVPFSGGEAFKWRGEGESCTLTVEGIAAQESIAIYFDNGDSKGSQINATWAIDWERPDATQPTITVTPAEVALIPGATYQLSSKVDPNSFSTVWASDNEAVATVSESGLVTAVAPGTANISLQWADDATVAGTAVVTVANFDINAYNTVKSFDFTAMGDVTLTIESEAAGAIWNEANNKPNNVFYCTNEGLQDIAVQAVVSSNKGWSIVDGVGLKLASGAGRCAAIGHLTAGQVVEIVYTGSGFFTGSKDDAVRKDDGAPKTALNLGAGRAIYRMEEDGMFGFEIIKGNAVEKIIVYEEAPAQSHEAYIAFDMSRLENWAFPKNVITGTEIAIPYYVQTYTGTLNNVEVALLVNGEWVVKEDVGTVEFDEEMGEGTYTGLFEYVADTEGEMTIQLQLSFDGSENNEGENETEEVVITVSNTAPEAPVLENIAALKAYEAQGIENVVLTLTDAKVTYAGTKLETTFDWDTLEEIEEEVDVVVLEDASAGLMLQGSNLGTLVTEGQVLNGKLTLSIESVWGEIDATLAENSFDDVVATDGEVTPMLITDDNLMDYLAAPDWRLVELTDVTFKVVANEYSDDTYLVSNQIGEIGIQDILGTNVEIPEDATKADTAVGYVYSLFGGLITAFQPVSFTNLITTGVESMKADAAANAPIYNLNGVRVAAPQKGIYIQNGKKVVLK